MMDNVRDYVCKQNCPAAKQGLDNGNKIGKNG